MCVDTGLSLSCPHQPKPIRRKCAGVPTLRELARSATQVRNATLRPRPRRSLPAPASNWNRQRVRRVPTCLIAAFKIATCFLCRSSRSPGFRRQRISGLRAKVPVPEQGTSASTRSNVASSAISQLRPAGLLPHSPWNSAACASSPRDVCATPWRESSPQHFSRRGSPFCRQALRSSRGSTRRRRPASPRAANLHLVSRRGRCELSANALRRQRPRDARNSTINPGASCNPSRTSSRSASALLTCNAVSGGF